MPKITQISIQEKNKKRCNIFIDGDFFIGIPIELVYSRCLKIGEDVDKAKLLEIASEKDYLDALSKATAYVSRTLKTKKQVKTYLQNKGYAEDIIARVIGKLLEYKYIDDNEYAKRYIDSVSSSQGIHMTKYKLMMKGLKKDDVEKVYSELNVNSKENALHIALKHIKNKENTKENLSKTYRYLISKGFTYDDANYAIEKLKEDE